METQNVDGSKTWYVRSRWDDSKKYVWNAAETWPSRELLCLRRVRLPRLGCDLGKLFTNNILSSYHYNSREATLLSRFHKIPLPRKGLANIWQTNAGSLTFPTVATATSMSTSGQELETEVLCLDWDTGRRQWHREKTGKVGGAWTAKRGGERLWWGFVR